MPRIYRRRKRAIGNASQGSVMPVIGWGWSLAVWGYALAWFLVNDRVKLAAYRIFDVQRAGLLARNAVKQV